MNLDKGLIIVIVLLAVVGAFVEIPMGSLAILVVGLVSGVTSPLNDIGERTAYLLVALAAPTVADSLEVIPAVGGYLNTIVDAGAIGAGGIWLASMTRAVVNRIKP